MACKRSGVRVSLAPPEIIKSKALWVFFSICYNISMTGLIAIILVGLGVFLYWFGYEVTSGKHKSDPKDKFFPLLGRNIDYVIGVAGIPMGIGMFLLAFGVWAGLMFFNYIAAAFVLFGVVRAYLPPEQYGPAWYRNKKSMKSKKGSRSKKRKK